MSTIEFIKDGGVCTPIGFSAAAAAADVKGNKSGKLDMAVLVSEELCQTAAVFTSNLVKAAPVKYSQAILRRTEETAGVIVNSGNANACTGAVGLENCEKLARHLENTLGLPLDTILTASTGVIGQQLPISRMLPHVEPLGEDLDDDNGLDFAQAIMTTDTVHKQAAVIVHTDKGSYIIGGCCKGAGMMDPAMATFLGFLTTDAHIPAEVLQPILEGVTETTFNRITIDGDMSTNDTLYLFSNGMAEVEIESAEETAQFTEALAVVCRQLALELVRDGEGATKCITIKVTGAEDEVDATLCAAKIANSPLVKTMFAGCDPNWGRLMASAGASGADFNPDKVSIWFDNLHYVEHGMLIDPVLEKQVYEIMKQAEYSITIDLCAGDGEALYYTCDLTKEYVEINADYRS